MTGGLVPHPAAWGVTTEDGTWYACGPCLDAVLRDVTGGSTARAVLVWALAAATECSGGEQRQGEAA